MIHAFIFLLMRWMHIGSASLIIGGLALIVLSASPIRALTGSEQLDSVIKRVETRYRRVLAAAMLGLVISGIYQWMIFGQAYQELGTMVLILLSVKILLAVLFFALMWAFQVDSMVGDQARAWRWMNLTLAVLVLMLAGAVRYLRLGS